ncbi:MAG: hypothetical protein Q8O14_00195 [bacterium]|jgi:hypothetical protein|nr:hypothetical protein [bacterium]
MRRLGIVLVACLSIHLAWAALDVPIDRQVTVFKKVLKFDQSLPTDGGTRILIVHEGNARLAGAMADAFTGAGFACDVVVAAAAAGALEKAQVAYFCPGTEDSAADFPAGLLTLCGSSGPVERNNVAMGLELVEGKPKLVVSLAAYNRCGHVIDSQVLALAKIIR